LRCIDSVTKYPVSFLNPNVEVVSIIGAYPSCHPISSISPALPHLNSIPWEIIATTDSASQTKPSLTRSNERIPLKKGVRPFEEIKRCLNGFGCGTCTFLGVARLVPSLRRPQQRRPAVFGDPSLVHVVYIFRHDDRIVQLSANHGEPL
jgi:hypothetical protein